MDGGQLVEKLIFSKDEVKLQQKFNQVRLTSVFILWLVDQRDDSILSNSLW